jgi:uncharacterized protein with ATP-grasp and redox domains
VSKLPKFVSVLDVKYGLFAELDALLLHFMTENSLEYTIDPLKNASPEQLRFMVALDEQAFYAPCSDWMFLQLLQSTLHQRLLDEYLTRWKRFFRLVRQTVADRFLARRILALCRHKFRMILPSPIIIPSRLMKRMLTIYLTQSGQDDPYREQKRLLNRRARDIVESPSFDRMINVCPDVQAGCMRIEDLRFEVDFFEFQRLATLSTLPKVWNLGGFAEGVGEIEVELARTAAEFEPLKRVLAPERGPLRILYLPHQSGELVFDLAVIRSLLRRGHRVVLALKEGFFFEGPSFWDVEHDPVLAALLKGAHFVAEERIGKNALLRAMRENPFVVISDGTRERLNPYRVSVTFSRAWKECDLVLAKGEPNYRRLIMTSHSFTRDVACLFRDTLGKFHLHVKPKADWVHKFGEDYISAKAGRIVEEMQRAKAAGKSVMFYSGIVGSIPGQTRVAIEIMNTFAGYLRSRLEGTFLINPAEHFEEGMDADDLMFMWEKVQRSGLLNVWRFQTDYDIEKSFTLLGRKVPPVWAGKDATYSTGCTKEMQIALDMQKKYRELQIIGPSPEKFFRRREYGVGKFCDVAIEETE